MRIFIKRPGGRHKHYSLVGPDGKTKYDERIDSVNRDLDSGTSLAVCEKRMLLIRDSFKSDEPPIVGYNKDLALALQAYKIKRKGAHFKRPESGKYRLLAAVSELGPLSLKGATEQSILNQVGHLMAPGRRYHVFGAINELLKFQGSIFRLHNPAPIPPHIVPHITVEQFISQSHLLPPAYAAYLGSLFATGCRFGELPTALLSEKSVSVAGQVLRDGRVGDTKNNSIRTAPVIPDLTKWVSILNTLGKPAIIDLRLNHEDKIRRAWKSLWNMKMHATRHSYCIAWAQAGTPSAQLAEYIGDTVEVCTRHYARYQTTNEQVERALLLWKKSKRKA